MQRTWLDIIQGLLVAHFSVEMCSLTRVLMFWPLERMCVCDRRPEFSVLGGRNALADP